MELGKTKPQNAEFSFIFSYTKMGFAGNDEPQFIIPTALTNSSNNNNNMNRKSGIEDLNVEIGWEAIEANKKSGAVTFIILFVMDKLKIGI